MIILIFLPLFLYIVIPAIIRVFIFPDTPIERDLDPNAYSAYYIRRRLKFLENRDKKRDKKRWQKLRREINEL